MVIWTLLTRTTENLHYYMPPLTMCFRDIVLPTWDIAFSTWDTAVWFVGGFVLDLWYTNNLSNHLTTYYIHTYLLLWIISMCVYITTNEDLRLREVLTRDDSIFWEFKKLFFPPREYKNNARQPIWNSYNSRSAKGNWERPNQPKHVLPNYSELTIMTKIFDCTCCTWMTLLSFFCDVQKSQFLS